MRPETKVKVLALAHKWRGEAEEWNIKYRDADPHGSRICVAALEGCAEELERLVASCSNS